MTDYPLILTLRMDEKSQAFFDKQRQAYFPIERNFVSAHLTLFHHLPDTRDTLAALEACGHAPIAMQVDGLRFLGAGVAYGIRSEALSVLRNKLSGIFWQGLKRQDRQGFSPHITIQNKVDALTAKILLEKLTESFQPFEITGLGMDLWYYLGGPWKHYRFFPFR